MATVYQVEIVSHDINYTEEELKKFLDNAIRKEILQKRIEKGIRNEITVEVKTRS